MNLQNLLFPKTGICETPELYWHRPDSHTLDLDGYFNLFYIEKHRVLTAITGLCLRVTLRGFREAVLMHDRQELERIPLAAEEEKHCEWRFPYDRYDRGVFWLRLIEDPQSPEAARRVAGCFRGTLPEDAAWQPEIAITICTFRREPYVLRNLRSMLDFFDAHPEIAAHYHVFLVDNGRTLAAREDFQTLKRAAGERLLLIENRNTGGTGGFSRGMEEAIRQKERLRLTNLLLLDDDAVFDPELFLRLYATLSSLRAACRDITVGGVMLREDMPYIRHAGGERYARFRITNPVPMLDLRSFDNCTKTELTAAETQSGLYSGWWCCCYSMAVIRRENLPMPMFIHSDDVQFGRKHADQGIVFLNGIGVWHQSFELRFPGVNAYYDLRNYLIATAVFDPMTRREIARWVNRQLVGQLLKFRYAEMHLAWRGAMDFFRGPDWLDQADIEKLHLELLNYYRGRVVMQPLSELLDREAFDAFAGEYLTDTFKKQAALNFYERGLASGRLMRQLLFKSYRLPKKEAPEPCCNADPPQKLFGCRQALLYEPEAARGHIVKRSRRELLCCAGMVLSVTVRVLLRWPKTAAAWKKRDKTGRP